MGIEQQLTGATNTIVALVAAYGFRVIGAIIILIAGWILSRLLHTAIVRLCAKSPRIDRTVGLFLANGARYAVLVDKIRETLAEAIAAGGSSLRDYVNSAGEAGYFQNNFFVYGRAGAACLVCKTPIRGLVQGQRSTFYCPRCQR